MVPKEVTRFFEGILGDIIERRQNQPISRKDMVQHWLDLKTRSEEAAKGTIQSDVVTEGKAFIDDVALDVVSNRSFGFSTIKRRCPCGLHHLLHRKLRNYIDDGVIRASLPRSGQESAGQGQEGDRRHSRRLRRQAYLRSGHRYEIDEQRNPRLVPPSWNLH